MFSRVLETHPSAKTCQVVSHSLVRTFPEQVGERRPPPLPSPLPLPVNAERPDEIPEQQKKPQISITLTGMCVVWEMPPSLLIEFRCILDLLHCVKKRRMLKQDGGLEPRSSIFDLTYLREVTIAYLKCEEKHVNEQKRDICTWEEKNTQIWNMNKICCIH